MPVSLTGKKKHHHLFTMLKTYHNISIDNIIIAFAFKKSHFAFMWYLLLCSSRLAGLVVSALDFQS